MSSSGNSALSARSLSALADVGTLSLCIKLMSLIATRRTACLAGVLLALLPISVRYSQEVRRYSSIATGHFFSIAKRDACFNILFISSQVKQYFWCISKSQRMEEQSSWQVSQVVLTELRMFTS